MERKYNSYRDVKVNLKKKKVTENISIPFNFDSISKESLQEIVNKIPDGSAISVRCDWGYYDDLEGIYLDAHVYRDETNEELQVRTIAEQKKQYGKYLRSIGEL